MTQTILSADPNYIDLALEETASSTEDLEVLAELAPGVMLLESRDGFWGLARTWASAMPIFARHIQPVDETLPLSATEIDLTNLAELVDDTLRSLVDPLLSFSVQSRIFAQDLPYKPFDLNGALAEVLGRTGAPLDVRNPAQILSLVCADVYGDPQAFLGLSPASLNLSDWAGGVRRFAREEEQISRAEFKLLEALDVFGIELPPRGVALDLGAAPGGWTRVLRQREQYVTALDPADLDPRLLTDSGVRHLKMTAQEYLADEPETFDLIVNDMRMDPAESAALMVEFAPYLYPHGVALMTFKLTDENRVEAIERGAQVLKQAYQILGMRQLFHNRSEITVELRPAAR